jgi:hypothetical protein
MVAQSENNSDVKKGSLSVDSLVDQKDEKTVV